MGIVLARASSLVCRGVRRRPWIGIAWLHSRARFSQCVACGAGHIIMTKAPRCAVTHVCAHRRTTCAARYTVHVFTQLSHSLDVSDLAVCCAHGEEARIIMDCGGCDDPNGRRMQKTHAQSLVHVWKVQVARGLVAESVTKQERQSKRLQCMLEKGAQLPSYALPLVDHDLWHLGQMQARPLLRTNLHSWRSHCRLMWLMQHRSYIAQCDHTAESACWLKS